MRKHRLEINTHVILYNLLQILKNWLTSNSKKSLSSTAALLIAAIWSINMINNCILSSESHLYFTNLERQN